jgi:branched-chain amino acid transport system substrate-binding protein
MLKRYVPLTLSLVLITAACGDSGEGSGSQSDSGSGEDLQLAVIQHLTGDASEYGLQIAVGARLAAEKLNADGGVNGGEVVLTEEDEGEPTAAVGVIRKVASSDAVAIVGPQRSSSAIAANDLVAQLEIPTLTMSVSAWDAGPYMFKPAMAESNSFPLVMETIAEPCGIKTAAIISALDDEYAVLLAEAWETAADEQGIEIVATEEYATGDTDFSVQLTSIVSEEPDMLFVSGLVAEAAPVIREARTAGYKGLIQVTTADPTLAELSGGASDGVVSASPWNPESTRPEFTELRAAWEDAEDTELSIWTTYGYDLVHILAQAAERAGTNTDRAALNEALGSGEPLEGALGQYAFDGHGDNLEQSFTVFMMDGAEAVAFDPAGATGCETT